MRYNAAGFTLTELIVVLVLLGILAAYIAPHFTGRDGFSELTVQQDLIQSIRFAQQLAMSRTDRTVSVAIATNSINVLQDGVGIGAPYPKSTGSDVSLSPTTNLTFTRLGSPNTGATINVIGSVQTLSVTVEGNTGYAH